ncbi:MAG: class I SAM-dependent methyltransferase [Gammaproteobacteria bacterium]|nr:class I SAM-dependent methyltransferase [Gammaproteobacteria bacterium]
MLNQTLKWVEQRLGGQDLPVAIELWDGQSLALSASPKVKVKLRSPRALLSLVQPTLGKLARYYVEQEIDLTGHTRDIIGLGESLCGAAGLDKKGGDWLRWWPRGKPADRRAIGHHYDVSNDFYALWLDRLRVYSCAYFRRDEDTLEQAQEYKLDLICKKLDLKAGERFLDIGCGWGGLILWAAEHYRVRATGVTLSRNQYEYVQAQIQTRGLGDFCEARLMDYRDIPETEPYDKIASVGMFEHVGRKNLPLYFGKIYRLLKPGGLVLNHGITSAGIDTVGLGSDISEFIEQYVFPGGELVHVSRAIESMSRQELECWDVECLRPHYVKTLHHWVDRLEANQQQARQLVGEDKYRVWRIYMGGSAHAFDRGWLSVYQILGGKPLENGAMPPLRGARGNGSGGAYSIADTDPGRETADNKEHT